MAIFKNKKTAKENSVSEGVQSVGGTQQGGARDLSFVLKNARITEKATMHSADGVYTFDIAGVSTKRDVKQAIRALYKVEPRMVRIVSVPTKMKRNARTGKLGQTRGGKKAYVYLKKGETITIG